ncbi:MAG: lectin-like domain-containing protein [Myxococcota bacterium]
MNRSATSLLTLCALLMGCSSTGGVGLEQDGATGPSSDTMTAASDAGGELPPPSDIGNSADDSASNDEDSIEAASDVQEEVIDAIASPEDTLAPAEDTAEQDTDGALEDAGSPAEDTEGAQDSGTTEPDNGGPVVDSGVVDPPLADAAEGDTTEDVAEDEDDSMEGDAALGGDDSDVEADVDAEADVDEAPPILALCPGTVAITGPAPESFHVIGAPFIASALVTGPASMDGLNVQWETSSGEILGQTVVLPDGTTSGNLDTASAPLGVLPLVARLETPDGVCAETSAVDVVFCQYKVNDDFSSLDDVAWKMFGSSYWDTNGWLEMTGTAQGQRGAVYNPQTDVAAGSVSITFSMATGGGSGADGFAMTIVQTDSIAELEDEIIASAVPGSGIGYAVGGLYGPWDGNAFTVEIDTYHNVFNGTNELHTDPTPNDHVAITLDGDAGNHLWWHDMGDVEDLNWRTVRVDVIGFKVRVWIDEQLLVEQLYPELQFRGGYIFFSGSTGYYTNFHRFDNLNVVHTCQ